MSKNFKQTVKSYLEKKGIIVTRIEQEGEVESIVCHISRSDNEKILKIQEEMQKELNVVIALSNMFGMNVAIIESENLS